MFDMLSVEVANPYHSLIHLLQIHYFNISFVKLIPNSIPNTTPEIVTISLTPEKRREETNKMAEIVEGMSLISSVTLLFSKAIAAAFPEIVITPAETLV